MGSLLPAGTGSTPASCWRLSPSSRHGLLGVRSWSSGRSGALAMTRGPTALTGSSRSATRTGPSRRPSEVLTCPLGVLRRTVTPSAHPAAVRTTPCASCEGSQTCQRNLSKESTMFRRTRLSEGQLERLRQAYLTAEDYAASSVPESYEGRLAFERDHLSYQILDSVERYMQAHGWDNKELAARL